MAVKRRKKKKCLNLTSGYMFNSPFEEKKVIGYLVNLIKSKFLRNKTKSLFEFSCKVLGEETIIHCLKESFPEIVENEKFADWIEDEVLAKHVPYKALIKFLQNIVEPVFMKRLKNLSSNKTSETEKRLQILKETFNLTNDELEMVTFLFFD